MTRKSVFVPTNKQIRFLQAVGDYPRAPSGYIQKKARILSQEVVGVRTPLEKRRLIVVSKNVPGPHGGRQTVCELTPTGEEVLKSLAKAEGRGGSK